MRRRPPHMISLRKTSNIIGLSFSDDLAAAEGMPGRARQSDMTNQRHAPAGRQDRMLIMRRVEPGARLAAGSAKAGGRTLPDPTEGFGRIGGGGASGWHLMRLWGGAAQRRRPSRAINCSYRDAFLRFR